MIPQTKDTDMKNDLLINSNSFTNDEKAIKVITNLSWFDSFVERASRLPINTSGDVHLVQGLVQQGRDPEVVSLVMRGEEVLAFRWETLDSYKTDLIWKKEPPI
jgi:hypothetical protein